MGKIIAIIAIIATISAYFHGDITSEKAILYCALWYIGHRLLDAEEKIEELQWKQDDYL